MLKFFRRIRQKLLDQGNLRKYLVYAIGEILLVVIGILIALQINNWNEERKGRKLEKEVLSELKDALLSDLRSLNVVIPIHTQILQSQNILIDWIEDGGAYNDSLSRHFPFVSRFTQDLYNTGPYESLKEMGIRIIHNDSLRLMIQDLYDFQLEWLQKNTVSFNYQIQHTTNFVNPKYLEYEFYDLSGYKSVSDRVEDNGTSLKPININKMRTDNEYLYQLYLNRAHNRYLLLRNMEPFRDKLIRLIERIEKELKGFNE